jgi:hypothetical protein
METKRNRSEKGHNQNSGEVESTPNSRDDSNTGDWNDLRDQTVAKDGHYNTDSNDNSGGAGSTGSEATNS